jgi:hypothetical protein
LTHFDLFDPFDPFDPFGPFGPFDPPARQTPVGRSGDTVWNQSYTCAFLPQDRIQDDAWRSAGRRTKKERRQREGGKKGGKTGMREALISLFGII